LDEMPEPDSRSGSLWVEALAVGQQQVTTGGRLSKYGAFIAAVMTLAIPGQLNASCAIVILKRLQVYLSESDIFGRYGDATEVRAGENWYLVKDRSPRLKVEWSHLNKCPGGCAAVPHSVGGIGNMFDANH
jgi:hypothetical protein